MLCGVWNHTCKSGKSLMSKLCYCCVEVTMELKCLILLLSKVLKQTNKKKCLDSNATKQCIVPLQHILADRLTWDMICALWLWCPGTPMHSPRFCHLSWCKHLDVTQLTSLTSWWTIGVVLMLWPLLVEVLAQLKQNNGLFYSLIVMAFSFENIFRMPKIQGNKQISYRILWMEKVLV